MNKFLKIAIVVVLCLIVILTVTLFACQNNNPGTTTTPTTTTTTTNPGGPADPECTEHTDADGDNKCDVCEADMTPADPECTEHTDANGDNKCDVCEADMAPADPECTEHVDANEDKKCDNCGADVPKQDNPNPNPNPDVTMEFTNVNDTVYVISIKLNVRSTPKIPEGESNIVAEIDARFATPLNRTGYNDEWTRIKIEGVEYYVKSDYVSENKPTTEFDESHGRETVYIVGVASSIRVRSTTNLDFTTNIITTLNLGAELIRLGVATEPDAEGIVWAKVQVKLKDETNTIGYINNKYLSTEPKGNNDSDMGIAFENNSDVLEVIAESSLYLRKLPLFTENGETGVELISVKYGTVLQRIGIASEADKDGIVWSKVLYNDEVYYVSSNPKYIKVKIPGTDEGKVSNYFDCFEITLPSTYVTMESDSHHHLLATPDKSASVLIEYTGDILLSEKQVVEGLIRDMKLEGIAEPRVHCGVVYFDFEQIEQESNKIVYTVVAVVNASEHTYYTLIFKEIGTRDDIQSTVFKYMESIRLINE